MKEYGRLNCSPLLRLIGLFFLGWLLIPAIYMIYVWLRDLNEIAKKHSLEAPNPLINSILFFIIPFWGIYVTYRVQSTLNDIWDVAQKKTSIKVQNESEKVLSGSSTEKVFIKCNRSKTKNPEENNFCSKCGEKLPD